MRLPLRLWAGLYGLAFHLVVVAGVFWTAVRNQAAVPASFWWTVGGPYVLAAFAVYGGIVAPYVPKRPATKGSFFWDCAIGMLAEVAIVAATAVLFAIVSSAASLGEGAGAFLAAVANRTVFGFLWAVGSFFLQVLVVGNAAGLAGFWILRRVNAARAAAPR